MVLGSEQQAQPLGVRDCLALLRSVPVGRLVYHENVLPEIRPVNFAVVGDSVVIWSVPGSEHASITGQVVAFEADEIDTATRSGWSVVVIGKAEHAPDAAELARSLPPGQGPWVAGPFERTVRIPIVRISGRRLGRVA